MGFTLPNFNLLFDMWVDPDVPSAVPPTFSDIPCQVYVHAKADIDQINAGGNDWVPPIYLRVPLSRPRPQVRDVVQVKYLALDYYVVTWTQNIHMGFPNEYVMVLIKHCTSGGKVEER
jgi:hypothetical protein